MKRNTVERERRWGLRPIVSPSTHKGRRRQGIISLICQELWLPAEGESEQEGKQAGPISAQDVVVTVTSRY